MSISSIDLGTAPAGTDGDTNREAFGKTNSNFTALDHVEIMVALSDETTDLAVATGVVTIRMPFAMTLEEVRINVNTAPTGAAIIVDVNQGGASVVATERPAIIATEKTSTTSTTPGVVSTSALTDDAEITFDIDQVGSTVAGKGLKATLIGKRA